MPILPEERGGVTCGSVSAIKRDAGRYKIVRNFLPLVPTNNVMTSDRVFALAIALLGGRVFTFVDVRGLRYRATRDVVIVEELEIAVAAGDAFDVARAIVRIGARDLRGQTILER